MSGRGSPCSTAGYVFPERRLTGNDHAPLEDFHLLSRDIYMPPGKIGFWQIAYRQD